MNRRKSICAIGMANQIQNKQLEESLTNEIDQNLRVIAFLHPFSESVKKLLVKVIDFEFTVVNSLQFFLNMYLWFYSDQN